MSAIYNGDGDRVFKTENGWTTIYVNPYFEYDGSAGVFITHYYLGGQEIAYKNDNGVKYVTQDQVNSTVVTTDCWGGEMATVKYYPYGATRSVSGTLDTDKLFTGQRLDDSGLYFYNARYYDASIGRFISADSIVPDPADPQNLNRYTYCLNNPLSREQEERRQERAFPFGVASDALTLNYASCAGGWQQAASAREASWVSSGPAEAARGLARAIGASWGVLTHWPNIKIKGNMIYNSAMRIPGGSRYFDMHFGWHGHKEYWHFNANTGLLERFNGTWLPSTVVRYAKAAAKGLVVVGAALDAYDIYSSVRADRAAGYGGFGPETREAVGRVVGGWGGAVAGAALGAAIGSAVPVVGTFVGCVAGAIAGAIGGSKLGEWIASWFD